MSEFVKFEHTPVVEGFGTKMSVHSEDTGYSIFIDSLSADEDDDSGEVMIDIDGDGTVTIGGHFLSPLMKSTLLNLLSKSLNK